MASEWLYDTEYNLWMNSRSGVMILDEDMPEELKEDTDDVE